MVTHPCREALKDGLVSIITVTDHTLDFESFQDDVTIGRSSNAGSCVRQKIIANFKALRMRGVSVQNFIDFWNYRDEYEKQVDE